MKINKILLAVAVVSTLGLASCGGGGKDGDIDPDDVVAEDLSKNVTLNMSVMYQKSDTRMTFNAGNASVTLPYTSPSGEVYNAGDFKPVWKAVQNNLNIKIVDQSTTAETIANNFTNLQANNFSGVDIAQGSSSSIIQEGTTNDSIVDLSKYLELMPNFKKFLEDNPVVRTSIQDGEGAIYYAPYFDGFDDLERMLMLREDWVVKLLDGEALPTLDTGTTISKAYTAALPETLDTKVTVVKKDGSGTEEVSVKYNQNIITKQNALTTLNGAELVKALRDYIDTTYGGYYGKERSDLFVGQNAAYNVDELIALYRCVKANPTLLTGSGENTIVPLFPRDDTNDRTADLWRFTQFFGVRGGESRNGYLYVDSNGNIQDARNDAAMADALEKMHQMYQEGLILQDFTNASALGNTDEYRKTLLQGNLGFSTYDYNQTTTIYNDTISNIEGFKLVPVLPAVADWKGDGKYFHFTESWRSVKSEGWFITKNAMKNNEVFRRCLTIFDYFYGDEGNQLMSYGPDEYLEKDANGKIVTIDYQGKQVAKLNAATKQQLATLASGNYTNFYRRFIGATYPVGYVKQQGMEYQCVSEKILPEFNQINKAIELGVLKHVTTGNNTDHFYDMVPTTFSFTEVEQDSMSNFTTLDNLINNTKSKTNVWSTIVQKGFSSKHDTVDIPAKTGYVEWMNTTYNVTGYENLYNTAYKRMID